MGLSEAEPNPAPDRMRLTDRTNRSLIATALGLAIVSLIACWFGTHAVTHGIVNFEGRETAKQWAIAFAHMLEPLNPEKSPAPLRPYSAATKAENFIALDDAVFAGDILGYRIYNTDRVIVASSRFVEIGTRAKNLNRFEAVELGDTHVYSDHNRDHDLFSGAIAPLIWKGRVVGSVEIDVDLSARAAQLNRLRYMAFAALALLLTAVFGILGISIARTLRKHREAQTALTQSESQHRRLFDEAPDAMVIHNLKRVLYANDAAVALHGADTLEDLVGLDPVELVPDNKREAVRDHRLTALNDGQIVKTESLGRRRLDGSVIETDTMGIPIRWNGEKCILIQSRDVTEKRAAQRSIADREAQLTAFMDHSPSVMFIKGLDGRTIMASRQHKDLYGLANSDVVGRHCREWMPPKTAELVVAQDHEIIETGRPGVRELALIRADGEMRTVSQVKFPIRNADGDIVGIGGVTTDITDIKEREEMSRQAQSAAERAQALLTAFLDHSPSGMYLKDRNMNITMVNRAFEKFYGVESADVIDRTTRTWMPKHIADELDILDLEILRSGEALDMEIEFANADGDLRTLIYNKFPVFAPSGDIVGIGGVNTDVTNIRRQEAEIMQTQARLSAYIDHIPMMVMLVDRDSRVLMANSRYEDFFGICADEMVGKTSKKWVEPELYQSFSAENLQICQDQEPVTRIVRMRNAAGQERVLQQIKFPIVTGGDIPVVVGMILSDVTEQKNHERDIEQARDAAEAASRAKSAFLANMSHEIRTPMNGVFGMAELLAQTHMTPDQHRYLNTIRRSGEALLGVINNILDVSRIEAGEFRLDINTFDLHELVADAVELFAESASAKKIDIAHKISGNVPLRVQSDAVRLRQILVNLIGNAIKFTKDGEVVIRVTRTGGTDEKAVIRFEVADTGIGIPVDQQAALFDPFQQADASITRKYGGTGLGLSIAQHIVGLMGGNIEIDSRPDIGSSFGFSISLSVDMAGTDDNRPSPENLCGKRLLIVDDNAVNREILSEFAIDWNMEFFAVSNAADAQNALLAAVDSGKPFDVALLDIVMPKMDGISLAEWIGGQKPLSTTRLIALTSFNWDSDNTTSRKAGISHFVTKPVRRSELCRIIDDVLTNTAETDSTTFSFATPGDLALRTWHGAKVLLAEDNPVNQELGIEYLMRLGCSVKVADNGAEAVDQFAKNSFDLILMDVQMPEMDGIDATRQIRDLEARNGSTRIPIIAATAHAFQDDREKCILAGMDDFLSKPYTRKDIVPVLDRWLKHSDFGEPAPVNAGAGDPKVPDHHPADLPSDTSDADILDSGIIEQLRSLDAVGGDRIFRKVAGVFLESVPPQLENLKAHIASQNFPGISMVAHGLKTSAANVAAVTLGDMFRDLEIAARNEDIRGCEKIAGELFALYDNVADALERMINAVSPLRDTA